MFRSLQMVGHQRENVRNKSCATFMNWGLYGYFIYIPKSQTHDSYQATGGESESLASLGAAANKAKESWTGPPLPPVI